MGWLPRFPILCQVYRKIGLLRKNDSKSSSSLRRIACSVALFCVSACLCLGQHYSFRQYTEGLGNLNITCLAQERTGYLWVGTQNGLYRYDGSKFQRYGADQGVPDRIIDNIYVGNDGTLWVGTTGGIYFKRRDGSFAQVKVPVPVNEFSHPTGTTFASNKPDQVVTTATGKALLLQRMSPDEWVAKPFSIEGGTTWSVLYGPDGSLWYGCDKDLCRLSGGKTARMRAALNLPEDQWVNLLLARNGHVWLRSSLHVAELLPDGSHSELHDLPGPAFSEPYPALAEDAQGRILTSQRSSLGLWEKDHWRMVTDRNGLSSYEVQDLFVDREGSVWMGVVGHGLMRWVGEDRWEAYTAADGLSDNLVWASLRDHKGRLWIGTESGLNWIPAGANTPEVWKSPGVQTSRAGALEVSADGAIWMGSMAGSVVRIDPDTLVGTQWKTPPAYNIISDGPHRVWIATMTGMYQLDPTAKDRQPQLVQDPAFSNSHPRFTDMSLDPSGHLWVSSDQGLFERDQSGWHLIDLAQSGAKPDLLAVDLNGNVWCAGPSQDFMRLRVSGYKVTEAEHIGRPPLMSQEVVSLVVDHRGWLWVGQDAGVTVYDGHRWRSFTQDDGLIWNDTDSFALNEDRDGSIWIGTSGGLSHLIAPQAALAGSPPPPAFSQVMLGSEPITDGASIKWSSNPLVISMALLSFKDTQDIGIRYRLIGEQGSGWEDTREMTVRYRHLAPGPYRFEVAAVNASGSAVSPVASLSFQIVPLWWQNRGVQIAFGLFVLYALVYMWRRRVGLLMRQKRLLEDAVKGRTSDLEREKTELVRTKEQMRHFAEHDGLTGLWNHRIIVERLNGEVERSKRDGTPLSIILIDLDYFKRVNDLHGHMAGDLALKEAGLIFQRAVRSYDWVGRYGGEEFLLILPDANLQAAQARAEHLRTTLQAAIIEVGDTKFSVTASFGVASGFPNNHEAMIQIADTALYRAKNSGRNCVIATELEIQERPVTVEL
jgi:diguanylate cyclase (GGDEF)-like protein